MEQRWYRASAKARHSSRGIGTGMCGANPIRPSTASFKRKSRRTTSCASAARRLASTRTSSRRPAGKIDAPAKERGTQLPAALPKGLDSRKLRIPGCAASYRRIVPVGPRLGGSVRGRYARSQLGGQSPRLDNAFPPFLLPYMPAKARAGWTASCLKSIIHAARFNHVLDSQEHRWVGAGE